MNRAEKDDEVYFHHNGEPKVGKVLCTGRHGCVVDHEGDQHKLKWEHIAGHKSRAKLDHKVLHSGRDGMIVENQHGRRTYIDTRPDESGQQKKARKPDNP